MDTPTPAATNTIASASTNASTNANRDIEGRYQLRFYFFLICGVVVSVFYIVTLGIAFNVAQYRTVKQIESATRWHKREYKKAWDYRKEVLEHMKRHEGEVERSRALEREFRDLVERLDLDRRRGEP